MSLSPSWPGASEPSVPARAATGGPDNPPDKPGEDHDVKGTTAATPQRESDLYAPVKYHLESLGYTVRGEVGRCDILAVSEATILAVELKLSFGLPVLYQALQRLPSVDLVYIAVAVPEGRAARRNWDARLPDAVRLCRMLGIGLLSLRNGIIVTHADPGTYQPRKQHKQRAKLLGEFVRRSGDHNTGGTTRRPRMTAYREDALACASLLATNGAMQAAAIRDATGIATAGALLRNNVYGWFEKIARGTYTVTPAGQAAVELHADIIAARQPVTKPHPGNGVRPR